MLKIQRSCKAFLFLSLPFNVNQSLFLVVFSVFWWDTLRDTLSLLTTAVETLKRLAAESGKSQSELVAEMILNS